MRVGAALVTSLSAISLFAADPFARLSLAPVDGGGLLPILEHPAMVIHPPLLYVGLLATLPAFLGVFACRRWLALSAATLTVALALGAWWSYAEQGWGGYWAWDPVENGGFLPWLAAVAALHVPSTAGARLKTATSMAPFVLAMAGTWLTRSGNAASVHAFADARVVGRALLGVVVVLVVASWVAVRRLPRGDGERVGGLHRMHLVANLMVLTVVGVGTLAPVIRRAVGGPLVAIDGRFFARLLAPVVAVSLVGMAMATWRGRSAAQRLAHIGLGVMLVGVVGTVTGRHELVILTPGQTASVAGRSLVFAGTTQGVGSRPNTTEVRADVSVDGYEMSPSFVVFNTSNQLLVETASSRRWWGDVQVVMAVRSTAGPTVFNVHVAPLQSLVWLGALVMAVGLCLASIRRWPTTPATCDHSLPQ